MSKTRARQVRRIVRAGIREAEARKAAASIVQCTSVDQGTHVQCELVQGHPTTTPHRWRVPGSVVVVAW